MPLQVILNQIVLGPCVIAVIFAWNNLWLGKLAELPSKYQKDALPTLLYGDCLSLCFFFNVFSLVRSLQEKLILC